MGINLSAPRGSADLQLKPRITVIGVGGAGGNAVNNMISKNLEGVDFVVANTDAQAMSQARTERRIQLGVHTTEGLGAGARPEVGRQSAEEALEQLQSELAGSHMAFITAGMGGGTGTGAAPVIARAAREMGILTVGVVTKPFHFEGIHRMRIAEAGMEELTRYVDTLIIIPNQNLFRVANERTTFAQAFNMADDVLYAGVRGVTDLMLMPGLINLDFADIRTVMSEMGKAMMGTGEAEGEKRALDAAEAAISNPLLDDTSMKGARGVLINITGGPDMTLYEVDEAANRIRDEVDPDANIIFGSTFDERLEGKVRVSVVATGIESEAGVQPRPNVYDMQSRREQQQPSAPPPRREPAPAAREPAEPPRASAFQSEGPKPMVAEVSPSLGSGGMEGDIASLMESASAPLPEAPVAPRPTVKADAFIPAAPMEARDLNPRPRPASQSASQSAPRPAPAVAPVGGSQGAPRPAQPSPVPTSGTPASEQRRPQTLLEKVAGIGRIRAAARPETREAPRPEGRDPSTRMSSSGDQSSLKAEPEDRLVNSGHGEDDLDIPAFLRRQAN
ncbi:MAG: cell division protein FtsZ [Alphaproteobacteria bacterium]